jgi:hypothetical protein
MAQHNPFIINSAASTNAALITSGGTRLKTLVASNTGGAVAFVKLYNKAAAPTVGTDAPAMTIPVAADGIVSLASVDGLAFPTGLAIAITNLGTDADDTAVAAGQVKVLGNFEGS